MSRVLVIDDHDSSRKNLVSSLTKSGYKIAGEGASGASGKRRISHHTELNRSMFARRGRSPVTGHQDD